MARLPTPGGDNNNWGTVLNDYLQQSLDSSGLLVTAATNPYTTNPNTNLASGSQPGLVQLAGDIGNTAISPTVVGLRGNAVSSGSPSDGNVLTWSASGSHWAPAAPVGGSGFTGDIDGGSSTSTYSGTTTIDGGDST